ILEHERAHSGPFARVGERVGSTHGSHLDDRPLLPPPAGAPGLRRTLLALVIVFDAARALLLLGEADIEVAIEVAAERGGPGKGPSHAPLISLQLCQRPPRHRPEHHVMVGEVHGESVEAVRDGRAGWAARRVVRPEHEMIDEELRAPSEEIWARGSPFIGVELIRLLDLDPWQLLTLLRQLVTAMRELLLRLE